MEPHLDTTPRLIRVDGKAEPITKPINLAEALGCRIFAVLPLPGLGDKPHEMVVDAQALLSLAPINKAATEIFNHYRQPSLGPIRGAAAVLPVGHMGAFYP